MKNIDYGNFLVIYYQDRLDLFHGHFEKANANSNEENIHEFRVDIKTLRAILLFFEMLFSEKFNSENYNKKFSSLFKIAGNIREIQINRNCLSHYKLSASLTNQYKSYLKEKENNFKEEFKIEVRNFNFTLLNESMKKIKNLFKSINNNQIIKKCFLFLKQEAKQIKQLLQVGRNSAILHKIRMHMKLLSYVTPILFEFRPSKGLKKIIELIKKSNSIIGDWHDEIMLVLSLEKFAIKNDSLGGEKLINIISVINKIKKTNELFFEKIKDKINIILKNIQELVKMQNDFQV